MADGDEEREARAKLRREMHDLDQRITLDQDSIADARDNTLEKLIKRSNDQTKQIRKPGEQLTSSVIFSKLVTASSRKSATPAELVRQLRARYAGEVAVPEDGEDVPMAAFDWAAMGVAAATCYRASACAAIDFMLGAVEAPKIKAKVQRAPRAKQALAKQLQPDNINPRKQDDENETSKLTEAMFELVEAHNGAPYAHFVLNHESFAQTVENMFSVAMLVGNAKVALRKQEEWGMSVHLVKGGGAAASKAEPAQMVFNMNYDVWSSLKGAVAPDDCLTPHRAAIALAFQPDGVGGKGKKRAAEAGGAGPAAKARKS